jgi:futalosine hydrolase
MADQEGGGIRVARVTERTRSVLVVAATERELAPVEGARTALCGVGPVEAAVATARSLAEERPDVVLHVGIAGARGLEPLALVLGTEAVYCDAAGPLVPALALPHGPLLERVHAAVPEALLRPIGTSARVGGSHTVEVEAMEGFAVLRACELAGVPAVELRVVANEIDEPDRARWRFEEAFAKLAEALPRAVQAASA